MRWPRAAAAIVLVGVLHSGPAGADSLRFFGHGGSPGDDFVFPDRVKIASEPPAAANVGAGDFTVEFFLRSPVGENPNPSLSCGPGIDWVNSNIVIDRDRFGQGRKFGIGLLGGGVAFGASDEFTSYTLCGATDLREDTWHHVAVERRASDGRLRIWLDGALEAEGPVSGGPTGDMSYPASAVPGSFCNPDGGSGSESCENSDPFLVFGAEKHGFSGINFSGWLTEVRLSTGLRYTTPFAAPTTRLTADTTTLALYHFDEGSGTTLGDTAPGASDGTIFFGGAPPSGPVWSSESPFAVGAPSLGGRGLASLAAALVATAAWARAATSGAARRRRPSRA